MSNHNTTNQLGISELWYTRCPVPTVSSVALDLGWLDRTFAKNGISFKSLRAVEDRTVRESHYDHKLKGLFREGGNVPSIWARATGKETRVIALTWVDEYQAILTLPDSGIEAPRNLRDRRLALPQRAQSQIDFSRSMALRGFLSALSLVGLDARDVNFVDVAAEQSDLREPLTTRIGLNNHFQAEVAALLRQEVDAVYVKGAPGVDLTVERGLKVAIKKLVVRKLSS